MRASMPITGNFVRMTSPSLNQAGNPRVRELLLQEGSKSHDPACYD